MPSATADASEEHLKSVSSVIGYDDNVWLYMQLSTGLLPTIYCPAYPVLCQTTEFFLKALTCVCIYTNYSLCYTIVNSIRNRT